MKTSKFILVATAFSCFFLQSHAQDNPPPPPGGDSNTSDFNFDPPERPSRSSRDLAPEIQDKLIDYKRVHDTLREELKALIKAESKPTREKIREITKQFEAANQDRILQQKELARAIKIGLKESRPERPTKPQVSDQVKTRVNLLRLRHDSIHQTVAASKQALKAQLAAATGDQRKLILDNFRQEQKNLHEELKNIQRKIREILLPDQNSATSTRPERRKPPTRDEVVTGDRRTTDR